MDRLLLNLLVLLAHLLPLRESQARHAGPGRYRGRRRCRTASTRRLLLDHEWTTYLKQMGAWRRDERLITI